MNETGYCADGGAQGGEWSPETAWHTQTFQRASSLPQLYAALANSVGGRHCPTTEYCYSFFVRMARRCKGMNITMEIVI